MPTTVQNLLHRRCIAPLRRLAASPCAVRSADNFRAAALKHPHGGRAPWRMLPETFCKPDTASRTRRRRARAGLWVRLLAETARPDCPPALAGLAHRICRAFRRAVRRTGPRAIVLARRLGLHSALTAPSQHLSEIVRLLQTRIAEPMLAKPRRRPPRRLFRALDRLPALRAGRARILRWTEPA